MRLGKIERQVLYDISITPGDVLVGFLCSAGSTYRAKKVAHNNAVGRAQAKLDKRTEYNRRKRIVNQLAKKNLISLVDDPDGERHIMLEDKARDLIRETELLNVCRTHNKAVQWDGQWTLITFDIPTSEGGKRYKLVSMLRKIGFVQVQLSNYVFPYWIPEIKTFLESSKSVGKYCHLFRGSYHGDESKLKKKFNL